MAPKKAVDLTALTRPELQKLAKENGIKANLKTADIVKELSKKIENEEEAVSSAPPAKKAKLTTADKPKNPMRQREDYVFNAYTWFPCVMLAKGKHEDHGVNLQEIKTFVKKQYPELDIDKERLQETLEMGTKFKIFKMKDAKYTAKYKELLRLFRATGVDVDFDDDNGNDSDADDDKNDEPVYDFYSLLVLEAMIVAKQGSEDDSKVGLDVQQVTQYAGTEYPELAIDIGRLQRKMDYCVTKKLFDKEPGGKKRGQGTYVVSDDGGAYECFAELFDLKKLEVEDRMDDDDDEDHEDHEDDEGKKNEKRMVLLGLDASGKTSFLYQQKLGQMVPCIPTIGFNVESITPADCKSLITMWDIGGQAKLIPLWRHYLANTDAFLFFVDSHAPSKFDAAKDALTRVLENPDVAEAPVLVVCNKQDLPGARSPEEVETALGIKELLSVGASRDISYLGCSTKDIKGMEQVMEWVKSRC